MVQASMESNMPTTAELTPPFSGYNSTENGIGQAMGASWTSLPATEPPHPDDSFPREQDFDATTGDAHFFQPPEERDLHKTLTGSGLQHKLITGSVVVAMLAIGAFSYAFWPTALEKKEAQSVEAASIEQSAPVAPIEPAAQLAEPSSAACLGQSANCRGRT
jgi:hypothetical protein